MPGFDYLSRSRFTLDLAPLVLRISPNQSKYSTCFRMYLEKKELPSHINYYQMA